MKAALAAGIPWREVGGMTAEEISAAAQGRQEQFTELIKGCSRGSSNNGAALAGVAFNDPKRFPATEDAFPSLFEKNEQQDWRVIKQRMEDFAKFKNAN